MGIMFHTRGYLSSYIEKSSKTSLFGGRDLAGRPAPVQKRFKFSTLGSRERTAEAGAFEGRCGGSEPQRARYVLFLRDRERKGAVKHISGSESVHGMHGECR